jgi:hypothetical protein
MQIIIEQMSRRGLLVLTILKCGWLLHTKICTILYTCELASQQLIHLHSHTPNPTFPQRSISRYIQGQYYLLNVVLLLEQA